MKNKILLICLLVLSSIAVGKQVLKGTLVTGGGSPVEVVDPQLGGNLNVNGKNLTEGAALLMHLTGTDNTFWGEEAAGLSASGSNNSCFGYRACNDLGDGAALDDGDSNVAVGAEANRDLDSGSHNIAIGRQALKSNATSSNNTVVGSEAMPLHTSGASNTVVGFRSGALLDSGAATNTLIGSNVMDGATGINAGNTAVGNLALDGVTSGANTNAVLGFRGGNTITSGDNNTILGPDADVTTGTLSNAIALGHDAFVDASNKFRVGDDNVTLWESAPSTTLQAESGDFTISSAVPVLSKQTADPCGTFAEGAMFYNDTSNYMCYCDGTNDVQVHSPATACF